MLPLAPFAFPSRHPPAAAAAAAGVLPLAPFARSLLQPLSCLPRLRVQAPPSAEPPTENAPSELHMSPCKAHGEPPAPQAGVPRAPSHTSDALRPGAAAALSCPCALSCSRMLSCPPALSCSRAVPCSPVVSCPRALSCSRGTACTSCARCAISGRLLSRAWLHPATRSVNGQRCSSVSSQIAGLTTAAKPSTAPLCAAPTVACATVPRTAV